MDRQFTIDSNSIVSQQAEGLKLSISSNSSRFLDQEISETSSNSLDTLSTMDFTYGSFVNTIITKLKNHISELDKSDYLGKLQFFCFPAVQDKQLELAADSLQDVMFTFNYENIILNITQRQLEYFRKVPLLRMFFALINNQEFNYTQNVNKFYCSTMETTVEQLFLVFVYKLKPQQLESFISVLVPLLLDPLNKLSIISVQMDDLLSAIRRQLLEDTNKQQFKIAKRTHKLLSFFSKYGLEEYKIEDLLQQIVTDDVSQQVHVSFQQVNQCLESIQNYALNRFPREQQLSLSGETIIDKKNTIIHWFHNCLNFQKFSYVFHGLNYNGQSIVNCLTRSVVNMQQDISSLEISLSEQMIPAPPVSEIAMKCMYSKQIITKTIRSYVIDKMSDLTTSSDNPDHVVNLSFLTYFLTNQRIDGLPNLQLDALFELKNTNIINIEVIPAGNEAMTEIYENEHLYREMSEALTALYPVTDNIRQFFHLITDDYFILRQYKFIKAREQVIQQLQGSYKRIEHAITEESVIDIVKEMKVIIDYNTSLQELVVLVDYLFFDQSYKALADIFKAKVKKFGMTFQQLLAELFNFPAKVAIIFTKFTEKKLNQHSSVFRQLLLDQREQLPFVSAAVLYNYLIDEAKSETVELVLSPFFAAVQNQTIQVLLQNSRFTLMDHCETRTTNIVLTTKAFYLLDQESKNILLKITNEQQRDPQARFRLVCDDDVSFGSQMKAVQLVSDETIVFLMCNTSSSDGVEESLFQFFQ